MVPQPIIQYHNEFGSLLRVKLSSNRLARGQFLSDGRGGAATAYSSAISMKSVHDRCKLRVAGLAIAARKPSL